MTTSSPRGSGATRTCGSPIREKGPGGIARRKVDRNGGLSRNQARRLPAHGPARSRRHPVDHRGGHDWSARYPLVVEAVNHLFKVRSCLLDGEMVCCDEKGVTSFQLFRHRRNEPQAFLYAFDLLELNGTDLRAGADRGSQGDAGQHPAQEPSRRAPERAPGAPRGRRRVPARLQDGSRADCL
jgi:hypothetical protein